MNKQLAALALLTSLGVSASVLAADRDGATVYNQACMACHGSGAAGAPKFGDANAWKPRIATGLASLTKSAMGGKGAMPPKGGHDDLSEQEIKNAVIHMANKAGAKFK